jgi:hypothetical protein
MAPLTWDVWKVVCEFFEAVSKPTFGFSSKSFLGAAADGQVVIYIALAPGVPRLNSMQVV